MPLMMKAQLTPTWNDLDNRRSRWVNVIGRLKPGVTEAAAKARLDVLYQQINDVRARGSAGVRGGVGAVQGTLSREEAHAPAGRARPVGLPLRRAARRSSC